MALAATALGAAFLGLPRRELLAGAAVGLAGFGGFLFRGTYRSYRWRGAPARPGKGEAAERAGQFAAGFAVGAVETTEAAIVLVALAAGGAAASAVVGAVAGGVFLVLVAGLVHERIRRLKTRWLRWGATALVLTYAVFWAGEAAGLRWPGDELALGPLFVAALLAVRGAVALALRRVRAVPSG